MLITTTSSVPGREVSRCHSAVFIEVSRATSSLAGVMSTFSQMFGKPSASMELQLEKMREECLGILRGKAQKLGADALVGLQVNHLCVGSPEVLIMTAMATPVNLVGSDRQETP